MFNTSGKNISCTQTAMRLVILILLFFSLMVPFVSEAFHEHDDDVDVSCIICLQIHNLKNSLSACVASIDFNYLITTITVILALLSFVQIVTLVNLKIRMDN